MSHLIQKFEEYSGWRASVVEALTRYQDWISAAGLSDAACEQRLVQLKARLADDKLSIAFVAEFSRGKSELINAIFFADYGQRILPSSAGRTTMCPTELLYDETFPPCIRLLPIETRAEAMSTSDLKEQRQVWTVLPLDVQSGEGMLEAFRQVSLSKRVSIDEAKRYGLYDENDPEQQQAVGADGMVEISQWRHAIINFPHPLLKQGLVIIDTPGLNAIGTEPELTLNLIPNAHAVLFILAADTGVTRSDIDVWRNHIGNGDGRLAVLNKIDSMWDELRSPEEIEQQIARQVTSVAQILDVPEQQVFPVSAQKGLVGKINRDAPLLAKSRLLKLEQALSQELLPARQSIIRSQLSSEVRELTAARQTMLASRTRNVVEQLIELKSLRGKNQNVIAHMMKRIDVEKREFDASLVKLQGTRSVFAKLSADVYASLGIGVLKQEVRKAAEAMEKSMFSAGFRDAVKGFFNASRDNLWQSGHKIDEVAEMMTVMYRKFSAEHGLVLTTPMPFSLKKYRDELNHIEAIYHKQFGATALLSTHQAVLMRKFFESIATRVKHCFLQANRDVEAWFKVVMAPLDAQIREHKLQLKQRQKSVERIFEATDSLEEKIASFEQMQAELDAQMRALYSLEAELMTAIAADQPSLKAA
ncbi:dynamin family protein [Paucimonas lemoignei]|uniref:Dynamin family protein n=1 Tax=Paucimonas lemoignei TaxID=29443 RepID=A0A4R3HUU6_PAULE|nr:dynamin family protein [Paucimonas lemoignei]TCS37006.1 dynamin family protein [Paucimonas lemoignei]